MANKVSSIEAEAKLLSIILNNAESAYELEGLKYFMFSSVPHQELFKEIEEAIQKGNPVDVGLLINSLEANGRIARVGGKKNIENIVSLVVNKETLPEYKNIVISSYKTRAVVSLASDLTPEKVNTANVDDAISMMRKSLDMLTEVRGGNQTVLIGDAIKDIYDEIVSRKDHEGLKGVTWGIQSLDDATGGKCPGELWVIGGRPGAGKSAFICNSILQDAKNGVPSLMFQREMRLQEMGERFIALLTGIAITNIRLGVLNGVQIKQIYEACETIRNLPIYIDTSYRSTDLYYIESTIKKYKNLHNIKVVYLDYVQILVERDDNQTHEIGRVSRLFKSLANELDLCCVLLSQLNRGVEQRDNKRPILSDLRQSGNLEEDADVVVGLYRDEYYNPATTMKKIMEFIILKYRNGPVGTIPLKFEDVTNVIAGV